MTRVKQMPPGPLGALPEVRNSRPPESVRIDALLPETSNRMQRKQVRW